MLAVLLSSAAAVATLSTGPNAAAIPNPRSAELFERDPALLVWALKQFDTNGDGWLTSFEASRAADAFRALADTDHDGRVTMSEYRGAAAYLSARY